LTSAHHAFASLCGVLPKTLLFELGRGYLCYRFRLFTFVSRSFIFPVSFNKGYYVVLKGAEFTVECCFPLIPLLDTNQVIHIGEVKASVNAGFAETIEKIGNDKFLCLTLLSPW
jgi:hypothetical protein